MNYKYTHASKIGFKRSENEDAVGVYKIEGGLLAIVCDGLGGKNAGEVASNLTLEAILSFFKESKKSDYLARIKFAIENANSLLLNKSSHDTELKGMATTVEVLFLKGNTAYWGHIGDSRIYNLRNGKLKLLTKDHSLVQKLVDDGYLSISEAENHPNRNIITRAVGEADPIDIDLSKMKINTSDNNTYFICTDGVTTEVRDYELEVLLSRPDPGEISDSLVDIIESRGANDNFTYVIIKENKH